MHVIIIHARLLSAWVCIFMVIIGIGEAYAQSPRDCTEAKKNIHTGIAFTMLNHGLGFARRGEFATAISYYDHAITIDQCDDVMYRLRATAYALSQPRGFGGSPDYSHAIADASLAIALQPDHAENYHVRALIHARKKDWGAAMEDIEATLQRAPHNPDYLASLNIILEGKSKIAVVNKR